MIWQEKTQASKCFKEFRGLLLLFYSIKSMPQKCLSKKGGKGYAPLPSHTKSAVMCILRTCVCNNKNDHPRMKGMRKAPPQGFYCLSGLNNNLQGKALLPRCSRRTVGVGKGLLQPVQRTQQKSRLRRSVILMTVTWSHRKKSACGPRVAYGDRDRNRERDTSRYANTYKHTITYARLMQLQAS